MRYLLYIWLFCLGCDATHSGLGELEIWIRVVAAATTTTTDSLLNGAAKEKLPTRAGERAQL